MAQGKRGGLHQAQLSLACVEHSQAAWGDCNTQTQMHALCRAAARTCSVDDDAADGGVWVRLPLAPPGKLQRAPHEGFVRGGHCRACAA